MKLKADKEIYNRHEEKPDYQIKKKKRKRILDDRKRVM